MKKNIAKSRLEFCLLSLVLVAGVFNVKTMASGPGCLPTGTPGGCGSGVSAHPMATSSVNAGIVVASSLNTVELASGAVQTPLVTGDLNLKTMASGPGCLPTGTPGGCGSGVSGHPMRPTSGNGVKVFASLTR